MSKASKLSKERLSASISPSGSKQSPRMDQTLSSINSSTPDVINAIFANSSPKPKRRLRPIAGSSSPVSKSHTSTSAMQLRGGTSTMSASQQAVPITNFNQAISIKDSNTRYDCHGGAAGNGPHSHTHRGNTPNRHICKDCDKGNRSTEFRARTPKFPRGFKLKDLSIYSQRLTMKDTKKFQNMAPILIAEGRREPPNKQERGAQIGDDDFSDSEYEF